MKAPITNSRRSVSVSAPSGMPPAAMDGKVSIQSSRGSHEIVATRGLFGGAAKVLAEQILKKAKDYKKYQKKFGKEAMTKKGWVDKYGEYRTMSWYVIHKTEADIQQTQAAIAKSLDNPSQLKDLRAKLADLEKTLKQQIKFDKEHDRAYEALESAGSDPSSLITAVGELKAFVNKGEQGLEKLKNAFRKRQKSWDAAQEGDEGTQMQLRREFESEVKELGINPDDLSDFNNAKIYDLLSNPTKKALELQVK